MKIKSVLIEINDADPNFVCKANVPVFKNHDSRNKLGTACVYWDENLYADFELIKDCNGLYPSIGFTVLSENDGKKHIEIMQVGLCDNKNEDERIAAIH